MVPTAEPTWRMLPTLVLRQTGFGLDLLDPLVRAGSQLAAAELLDRPADVAETRVAALDALRPVPVAAARSVAVRVGQDRPPRPADLRRLSTGGFDPAVVAVQRHLAALEARRSALDLYRGRYAEDAAAARQAVVELFRDLRLRDVLLLSNDAVRDEYVRWLDGHDDLGTPEARRKLDTLVMYLQRVATKNETHSHFGPFTVGTVDRARRGVAYGPAGADGPVAFVSHWAAERLAAAASAVPQLGGRARPRRRPLAFLRDGRVDLYAFTSETGYAVDWRFVRIGSTELDRAEQWLLAACDGSSTRAELAARWSAAGHGDRAGFDRAVAWMVAADVLVDRFEVPPGDADGLSTLLDQLGPAARQHPEVRDLARLRQLLADFAAAGFENRPKLLAEARDIFAARTGMRPHRGDGRMYTDRSVLYEERRSGLRQLTVGGDLADFVETEMAVVYDLALAGPRLRMRRERAILTDWFGGRFGADRPVPIDRFYEGFFADRADLDGSCRAVEEELSRIDARITDALLGGADPDRSEVEVPRERLAAVLADYPAEPAALCNPDVMIAAASNAAIAAGDFLAVVGDCHAVRELLTHTSFSPLVQAEHPALAAETHAAYAGLLEKDEVLVDVVRGHPDKTAAQVRYPCPDLEVFGRSEKPREQVVSPTEVYLQLTGGRLELRAHGVRGRLRLMAPPAGGPSIVKDPLSVFSFPRHFGGVPLRGAHLPHLPRLRCGRLVLQRELWRVPTAEFRRPAGQPVTEADDYLAMQAMRRRHGLPRRVFAAFPGELKPVYVDWDAPLLVRQCVRMARTAADGPVQFSEMLPGPEELWLELGGHRHTSELRCAVFNVGGRR